MNFEQEQVSVPDNEVPNLHVHHGFASQWMARHGTQIQSAKAEFRIVDWSTQVGIIFTKTPFFARGADSLPIQVHLDLSIVSPIPRDSNVVPGSALSRTRCWEQVERDCLLVHDFEHKLARFHVERKAPIEPDDHLQGIDVDYGRRNVPVGQIHPDGKSKPITAAGLWS